MTELKISKPPKMGESKYQIPRIMIVCLLFGLASSRQCHYNHFWDARHQECRQCRRCPLNKIIRQPCTQHADTECGPFREFNFFNQINEAQTSSSDSMSFENFSDEARVDKDDRLGVKERHYNEPIVQKDGGEYWKNLAFALIGVVCVLIFVATIVVLVACRKLHQTAAGKRPQDEEDDDSGYVVIRAIRPPNRIHRPRPSSYAHPSPAAAALLGEMRSKNTEQSLCADHNSSPSSSCTSSRQDLRSMKGNYKPKRRLLNYDADDVFESEDSAGSRVSGKLQAIPEKSVSSDSDTDHDSVSVSAQGPV